MFFYDLAEAGVSLAYVSKEFRHTHVELSLMNDEIQKRSISHRLSDNLCVCLCKISFLIKIKSFACECAISTSLQR